MTKEQLRKSWRRSFAIALTAAMVVNSAVPGTIAYAAEFTAPVKENETISEEETKIAEDEGSADISAEEFVDNNKDAAEDISEFSDGIDSQQFSDTEAPIVDNDSVLENAGTDGTTTTEISIGSLKLNASTPYYHNGKNGALGTADNNETEYNAYFDSASGTLTLNNLNIVFNRTDYKAMISYSNNLKIVLADNSNNILTSNSDKWGSLISNTGNTEICGTGILQVNSNSTTNGGDRLNFGSLTIEGTAKVNINKIAGARMDPAYAMEIKDELVVKDNAELSIKSSNGAIQGGNLLDITDNATLNINNGGTNTTIMQSAIVMNKVTFEKNSKVELTNDYTGGMYYYILKINNELGIKDNTDVKVKFSNSNVPAIYLQNATANISGGKLTNESDKLFYRGTINISEGEITSPNYYLTSVDNVNISGGNINVRGLTANNVSLTGGTIKFLWTIKGEQSLKVGPGIKAEKVKNWDTIIAGKNNDDGSLSGKKLESSDNTNGAQISFDDSVSLDYRNGTVINTEDISNVVTPEWDNFEFAGWSTAVDDPDKIVKTLEAGNNYYAVWKNNGKIVRTKKLDLSSLSADTENKAQGWQWNQETKTLTLDNCTIVADDYAILFSGVNDTARLVLKNTNLLCDRRENKKYPGTPNAIISSKYESGVSFKIEISEEETGSLEFRQLEGAYSYGIAADYVTVNSGTINANTILSNPAKGFTQNGGKITVNGAYYGLFVAQGGVEINGGELNINSIDTSINMPGYVVGIDKAKFQVTDGIVRLVSEKSSAVACGEVNVTGGYVSAKGTPMAIQATASSASISAGTEEKPATVINAKEVEEAAMNTGALNVSALTEKDNTKPVEILFKKKVDINVTEDENAVYDGKTHSGYKTASADDEYNIETFVYHYTGEDVFGNLYDSTNAPINAGSYTLTVSVPEENRDYYGSTSVKFEISPRTLEVNWKNTSMEYNGKQQTPDYELSNIVPNDEVTCEITGAQTDANQKTSTETTPTVYTATLQNVSNANYVLPENASAEFEILPKTITDEMVSISANNNSDELFTIIVADNLGEQKKTLEEKSDYKINVAKNNDKYNITIDGIGNYTGQIIKSVTSIEKPADGKIASIVVIDPNAEKLAPSLKPTSDTVAKAIFAENLTNTEEQKVKDIIANEPSGSSYNAIIYLQVKAVDESQIVNDVNKIKEFITGKNSNIPSDAEIGKYLDLSLFMTYVATDTTGTYSGTKKINDLKDNAQYVTISIPDELKQTKANTVRRYYMIRVHGDETSAVQCTQSGNTLTFLADKFSTYAIAYKDTYYAPSYPVTGVTVSSDKTTLTKEGETTQITATVTPSYADNKNVTWKSSDEKVATVDKNGKVTAVGTGTATITATTADGKYSATTTITVKIAPEKLILTAEKTTLTKIGDSLQITAKVEPDNAYKKLIWKSSDEKVAVVDADGKVTAVGTGTATITATTEDGKLTESVIITVKIPDEPTVNETTGYGRLKARSVVQTNNSIKLEWTRVSGADGYIIYGNYCNGNGKVYKFNKITTITNGKTRTWTHTKLKKATYYKYIVKAYKIVNGDKVIIDTSVAVHATTTGGKYGVAKAVSITKIGNKKNVTKVTLKKGKTAQITAKEIKKDKPIKHHRNICYESSNTKVAVVTPDGMIQANGKGTCTIWVYAQNGVYKAVTVTVK